MRFLPDRFTLTLIATVLLATFFPASGMFVAFFNNLTIIAIGLDRKSTRLNSSHT